MYHRPTTRVLAMLELLQAHKRMSGSELARRMQVDVRTIRRYIAILEEIGIPITAEQGRDGGYALVAGFKLPPMMFTDEEAIALSIGLLAARELGVAEMIPAVDSARAKLERVMPEPTKHRLRDINASVHLDFSTPWSSGTTPRWLGELTAATHAKRRIHLRYISQPGDTTDRDFDPYGLAYRRGRWYTVGMCHLRNEMRTFRLDRVAEISMLDRRFERPPGFDVLEYVTRSFAAIPRAHDVELLLLTDLATAQSERTETIGLLEPCAGGVLLRTSTDSLDWFARWLACVRFEFEIRRPPELAEAVVLLAARLRASAAARGTASPAFTSGSGAT